MTVFSRLFSNDTSEALRVTEKLEEAVKVVDTFTFGFTEKINAGYESKVSVVVKMGGLNAGAESKFSMGVKLGASQTNTITAKKSICSLLENATFTARSKAYARVGYGKEDPEQAHIYIFSYKQITGCS